MPSHQCSHSPYPPFNYLGHSNRRTCAQKARWRPRVAQCAVLFAILTMACTSRADTVTLDNGDRLTGTIVKSDGKELVLMADKAGPATDKTGSITVPWSAVRQITSTAPLSVVTSQGYDRCGRRHDRRQRPRRHALERLASAHCVSERDHASLSIRGDSL